MDLNQTRKRATAAPQDHRLATAGLDHVQDWIFDLDNTLYPASLKLYDQIDQRVLGFIEATLGLEREPAAALKWRYFQTYGSSLYGLITHHSINPKDFLGHVYQIDLSPLQPDPRLRAALQALPGRKLIFTNAAKVHVEQILDGLGIADQFDHAYDIVAADLVPKPARSTYDRLLTRHDINPTRAIFFEDSRRNLAPAAALGMTTVLVTDDPEQSEAARQEDHVHFVTDDLGNWLHERQARAGDPSSTRSKD